jgi:hypothetical protein
VQPPKPDCFKGTTRENIDLWLFEIEQYFNAVSLEDKYRATYAASLLRDGALTWWRAKNIAAEDDAQLQQLYEWETFSNELKQQFKPINSEKSLEIIYTISNKQNRYYNLSQYSIQFVLTYWNYRRRTNGLIS